MRKNVPNKNINIAFICLFQPAPVTSSP